MTDSSRCPSPEQLAAFVAGSLSGEELTMVADHVRSCDDCRLIVADAARIDREPEFADAASPAAQRRISPWWLATAAAALLGVAYLSTRSLHRSDGDDAIRQLVQAAPRDGRYLEPRLSGGFAWAPVLPVRRDANEPADPREMKLIGAAGEVLEQTAHDSSPQAQHATALAHLLAGRPSQAASILARLAPASNDPRIWSDLAAAHYAVAVELGQPKQLADALVAADAALRIDPKLPEASFNRALAVERLGLRDRARAAWQQYLDLDATSPWADEARKHLARLGQAAVFKEELARNYARLQADEREAAAFAQSYRQEARLWGETEILGRWAEASQQGRDAEAAQHLALARTFGAALAARNGDRMLHDAVAAIDAATPAQRRDLVDAHAKFRAAQKLFIGAQATKAAPLFEQAAEEFARGGSPAALLARYFVANTVYDRNDIPAAHARLSELLASAPAQYPAHRAQVQWQMGLAQAASGHWGAAIDAFDDSVRLFDRLGEMRNAAIMRQMLSEVYDRIGDPQSAWTNRLAALQELGRSEDRRLQSALQTAARAASLEQDWPVSLSFLDLTLEMPRADSTDLLRFETLLFRARVRGKLAQNEAAADDLARSAEILGHIEDAGARERAEADQLAVTGVLASSPTTAVPNLTRAIEYHRVKGRRMLLPELYLERGRAYAMLRDRTAAAADFESGIREMEEQRLSLRGGDERWGMFASFDELFDEAVALAMSRGDGAAAFAYSERARARELLDSMGDANAAGAAAPASLRSPSDMILIEYATLPTSLVAFVIDHDHLQVVQTPVSRNVLMRDAETLADSAMSGDAAQFRGAASALYAWLLQPVNAALHDGQRLVVVPDAALSGVPFAALVDPSGKYLVERCSVVIAPSAAVFARLLSRPRPVLRDPRLLLIAGPAGKEGDVRQLGSAQREADAVVAVYHQPVEVVTDNRGAASFEAQAANADIIHFVGHSELPAAGQAALVTSRDGGVDARAIAALRLRRTRVVVLAACSTARARHRAGEESISIARSFLAAGASSVVATLWPIDDDPAAEFFPRLHHYLADGLPPAEAVRATQLEWIRRGDAPPGLWAAVQLVGS